MKAVKQLAVCVLALLPVGGWAADLSDVRIEITDSLKPLVLQAIEPVVSNSRLDDLGDVQQLYRRLRPIIRDLLGAQGYFSVETNRLQEGDEAQPYLPVLHMQVQEGKLSTVGSVDIEFRGAVAQPEWEERRSRLRSLWILQKNQPFFAGFVGRQQRLFAQGPFGQRLFGSQYCPKPGRC
ncbi:MAG: hypothetical protein HC848_07730 [Limnobacter sp.]|nr:hypothetical protein [Limnobacter sp.]